MKFFVGVTDNAWFRYLANLQPDEVNFWRPGGGGLKAIEIGEPFLFKLHSPLNYIVGGGFFVKAEKLPLSLAWDAFKEKNGAGGFTELRELIMRHREGDERDPEIGCIILNQPFFLPEDQWIREPEDWKPNIVTGKSYDTREPVGRRLWQRVEQLIPRSALVGEGARNGVTGEEKPIYGSEYLTRSRLGQGAFRVLVTSAYNRRCAITGERALPVLQAAHVKPITASGPNQTRNGLLVRSDVHILFDRGYVTVTPDHHVEVSNRIKEDFDDGEAYTELHGRSLITVPKSVRERPAREYLEWHNEKVFRG